MFFSKTKFYIKIRLFFTLLILSIVLLISCSQKEGIILSDTALMENPGEEKIKWVPDSLMSGGEVIIIEEEKDFGGKKFSKVTIKGSKVSGWIENRLFRTGAVQELYTAYDADIFQRPSEKSPSSGRLQAGQSVMELERQKDTGFSHIQFSGREAWIKSEFLTDDKSTIKKIVSLPGIGKIQVSSSSQFTESSGREKMFDVRNLFDGNQQTAWCEGAEGDGIGEFIYIQFLVNDSDASVNINEVSIITGWTKSEDLFKKNNRASKITIDTYQDNTEAGKSASISAELEDNNFDYQNIKDQFFFNDNSTKTMKITINDIFKGKVSDTCLSEIKIIGERLPADVYL